MYAITSNVFVSILYRRNDSIFETSFNLLRISISRNESEFNHTENEYFLNSSILKYHNFQPDLSSSLRVLVNKGTLSTPTWQTLFYSSATVSENKYDWKFAQMNIRVRELQMPEWKDKIKDNLDMGDVSKKYRGLFAKLNV